MFNSMNTALYTWNWLSWRYENRNINNSTSGDLAIFVGEQ